MYHADYDAEDIDTMRPTGPLAARLEAMRRKAAERRPAIVVSPFTRRALAGKLPAKDLLGKVA